MIIQYHGYSQTGRKQSEKGIVQSREGNIVTYVDSDERVNRINIASPHVYDVIFIDGKQKTVVKIGNKEITQ